LRFCDRAYTDSKGETRSWEMVSRTNSAGAVCIVAVVPGPMPAIILVKQYRPPLANHTLEFPAGLVECGEGIAETALRELLEETGCIGTLIDVGPTLYSSPGLTDETITFVRIDVTDRTDPQPQAGECIEIVELPLTKLKDELLKVEKSGVGIDAKLWYFAEGQTFVS